MNWKAWAPLAVAMVFGVVAAITARNLVNRRPAMIAAGNGGVQVVVARQPVLPGQVIKEEDVTTAPLAWKDAPEGTFKNKGDVIGRVVTLPMVKGQPVLESILASPGAGSGLQALVPEGMRAITIEVNEFSGIAGLIAPGCAVDVVATIEDSKTKERLARTIVQGVRVMAVGQRVSGEKEGTQEQLAKSVTLLTTPAEAEALELGSMIGRPRLVLRGNGDLAAADSNGVTVAQLCSRPEEAPYEVKLATLDRPTTRPARQYIVKVIKGGVESSVSLPGEEHPAAPAEVLTGADTAPAVR